MKFDRDQIRNLLPRQQPQSWFEIVNQGDAAEVRIYDEISLWGVTAEDFVAELDGLDVDAINCRINCPGGSVFDGIAIHNALAGHRAHVTTVVEGIAASAASFIVQAGDRRVMMRHSQMMVHNAQGLAFGDAATMREMADLLDKQNGIIAGVYADRAEGDDRDETFFLDLMASTTWMTDSEAVENGLADEVVTPPRAQPNDVTRDDAVSSQVNETAQPDVDWAALFEESVAGVYQELI